MKSSSGPKRAAGARVPLADAAELAGDGDVARGMKRLEAMAGNHHTWLTWKNTWKKVPAYKLTPLLLEWWNKRKTLVAEAERRGRETAFRDMEVLRSRGDPGRSDAAQHE